MFDDQQVFDLNYVLDDGTLIDRDNMYKDYCIGQLELASRDQYIGEISQSKMHGYGLLISKNQIVYQGQFEHNSKHGMGFQIGQEDQNNFKYLYGEWKYDDRQGEFIRLIDKRVHNQIVHYEDDKIDMNMTQYLLNQTISQFHIDLVDQTINRYKDRKEFKEVSYDCGDIYRGEKQDGYRHGYGFYIYSGGTLVEGDWVKGNQDGHGIQHFGNGDFYCGSMQSHKRSGQGVYIFHNGNKYMGTFQNSAFQGQGIYLYSNEKLYKGSFKDYFKDGHGVLKSSNRLYQYEGGFKQDVFHGKGKVLGYKSELIVEANFENGVIKGEHSQEIKDIIKNHL